MGFPPYGKYYYCKIQSTEWSDAHMAGFRNLEVTSRACDILRNLERKLQEKQDVEKKQLIMKDKEFF